MGKRQLWVRFENKERFFEKEAQVFEVLNNRTGDMEVKFFFADTRAVKYLFKFVDDETATELIKLLGEDNVKIKEIEPDIELEQEVHSLDRIADSLEGMAGDLERIADALEVLAECSVDTPKGKVFCISGTVYNG